MSEPDCDGSEYCQATQHIEGCYMSGPPPAEEDVGPPPPGADGEYPDPERMPGGLQC